MNQTAFFNIVLSPEDRSASQTDRLHRFRKGLAQDIGAALLFDSINLCSDCGVVNMKLNASRNGVVDPPVLRSVVVHQQIHPAFLKSCRILYRAWIQTSFRRFIVFLLKKSNKGE